MGRPRTSGRPIEKSTHLGTIVTLLPTPTASTYGSNRSPSPGAAVRPSLHKVAMLLPTPSACDGSGGRHNAEGHQKTLPGTVAELHILPTPHADAWGKYEPAIRRWEAATRPAPEPTEPNRNGRPRLSARFTEWLMGLPEGWVTSEPGISRADQLKTLGNGVCPQQAAAALDLLLAHAIAPSDLGKEPKAA